MAAGIRRSWPVENHRWLAIQPGARWVNKRWPAEHFAALVRQAAAAYPALRFAVLGSADDQSLAQTVVQAAPKRCLNLAGKISLQEMVEWIRLSDLLVTNDTGPMHIAAAMGKPLVALFGPTEPHRTGPYGQLDHTLQMDLPCVPCLKDQCRWHNPMECLRALPPGAAFAALQRLLPA